MGGRAISFDRFSLLPEQRLLLEDERQVRLGSRAFDILVLLVERAGEVVAKDELIARAWPKSLVEEANLKIQVAALRRALGDGQEGRRYVVTVPGRGYNFVAPVHKEERSRDLLSPTIAPSGPHNLPVATTRLIGREEIVTALVLQLSRQRLVTVVGPGGVGKTTVGLSVAERIIGAFEHGVWLVDLAPLRDEGLVPSAVATVLGLEIRTEDPLLGLVAALRDNRMLLLLDNCEHVIDAAASLAQAVLSGTAGVNILATSREPLGLRTEFVHRLGSLDTPEPSPELTAAQAATFPAVQLFVERATAIVESFSLTDANARVVVEICRRLDGLPLAIELAAPRVEALGVEGLAARLDNGLRRLSGAQRRATHARHRTMQAVLDWSYDLLSEDERRFFRALAIFAGGFTSEAAAAVAMDASATSADAIDRLADMVTKSLVVADASGAKPRFRLLDTTRVYAIEKLDASGEHERIARRHAEYYRDLFERAERESSVRPTDEWLADYAGELDNLRAALDRAFLPSGLESIGVALTVAAIPLWSQLTLVDECRSRIEQVFVSATRDAIDTRSEMKLQAALGASLMYAKGAAIPGVRQACAAALRLAESLGDTEYQLRELWELWAHHTNTGEFTAALAVAQKFHALALKRADSVTLPIANRMVAMSYHYVGDQSNAWRYIELMLRTDVDSARRTPLISFRFDQKVAGRVALARVLWIRGFVDQGWRTARDAVADAEALADPATLCYALCHGGSLVALWAGDLAAAERYAEKLLDHSEKHGFAVWSAFASRLKGVVLVKAGNLDAGAPLLRVGLEIAEPDADLWFLTGLSQVAEALGQAGRFADGIATIERGLDRSQMNWLAPELLRIKGELLLSQAATEPPEAVDNIFQQALEEARRQDALSWELRAATSLARSLSRQGRTADAFACLRPIYDRFTEGFGTADLIAAKQLLHDLGDHTGPQP